MRMVKKGGFTPCDRRIDRRKVALAAVAALLLFATPAKAVVQQFAISPSESTLGLTLLISGPDTFSGFGGYIFFGDIDDTFLPYSAPANSGLLPTANPSNFAPAFGTLNVNVTPGSLGFTFGDSIGYSNIGMFLPGPQAGQMGLGGEFNLSPGEYSVWAVLHGLTQTFLPGTTAVFAGGNNYAIAPSATTNMLFATSGTFDIDGAVVDSINLADFDGNGNPLPTPLFQTPEDGGPGAHIATFDGTTLTIPVNSVLFVEDPGEGIDHYEIRTYGQLVAHLIVPEPSTMMLFGFGAVGLLSYAWRKRRNLVA